MEKVKKEIEFSGFNTVYYFEFGKNFSHSPEKHDFWEMVYVDSGRINAITNGLGCTLTQGQAIFHEPMEVHAHVSDGKVPNNMIVVSFTATGKGMDTLRKKTFTLNQSQKEILKLFIKEAKNSLGMIPGDYHMKNNLHFVDTAFGSSQLMQCYFTEFLINVIRNSNTLGNKVTVNKSSYTIANASTAELISGYLKSKIYSNISLEDVCDEFLLGKTQLCKIFKAVTDKSPMEYYNDLKIAEASRLIREDKYSITEVSDMLGYSSIQNFSRAFKNKTGHSPKDFSLRIM